jgi:hypothetical protein
MTPGSQDDAQRTLEQHALRNVRGLVDRMEATEESNRRAVRRTLAWIGAAVAVLVVAILGIALSRPAPQAPTELVLPPPAKR